MSIQQYSCLETLPVEILHHLCDFLDPQSIVVSFRNTCQRLRAVAKRYDRYTLNLDLIPPCNFRLLCRLIDSKNVKSLTFSHEHELFHQPKLFKSLFRATAFIRLRSLTLIAMKESRLRDILRRVNISSLVSFSLHIGKSDGRCKNTTAVYISAMLARSKLRKLVLNTRPDLIRNIDWPEKCTVTSLTIGAWIEFHQFSYILRYLPELRTLVTSSCSMENQFQTEFAPARTVGALSINDLNMTIDKLERILRLTPCLTYLKLIGSGNFLDGHRWEQFIQTNLTLLKEFIFLFKTGQTDEVKHPDIDLIIGAFQTDFWMNLKKWFVTCEYDINRPEEIIVYSIPLCVCPIVSQFEPTKLSISTLCSTTDKDACIVVLRNRIGFDFGKLPPRDIKLEVSIDSTVTVRLKDLHESIVFVVTERRIEKSP